MTAAPDSGRRAAGPDDHAAGSFAAVDVGYLPAGGARAAIVIAASARFTAVLTERTADLAAVAPYVPGQFFRRELPPLRAVLRGAGQLRLIVIDGYVDLDPDGRPGLGAYVHQEFAVPVIGVAKTSFRTATHAIPVHRGRSVRPLYVTAAGLPPNYAAELISEMSGIHRLPDALRRADALSRGAQSRDPDRLSQHMHPRVTGGSGAGGT